MSEGTLLSRMVLCQEGQSFLLFLHQIGWSPVQEVGSFSGSLSRMVVFVREVGLCQGRWSLSELVFVREGGPCQGGWSLVKGGLSSGTVILPNSP